MATSNKGRSDLRRLIDLERGTVSREIFISQDVYDQEIERIFLRSWLFVGHESQVRNPGDFFVSRMGEGSVILTRDNERKVHVFLNTCRHRGMKVCRYSEGNTAHFMCPYHGWRFGTDGKLVGVPYWGEAYEGIMDRSEWALIEVAQMCVYKGGVWATWDPDAPSFKDYLGGMIHYLDALMDCRDGRAGGSEVIGGVVKWTVPCNWKFPAENFMGDMTHGHVSHLSAEKAGVGPGGVIGQFRQGTERNRRAQGQTSFPELGHGVRGAPLGVEEKYPFPKFEVPVGPLDNMPVVEEYFRHVYEERKKRLADRPVTWAGGHVFPNTAYHALFPRGIGVLHPAGPDKTEMWRWCLVDADAPKEVKDLTRHHFMRYAGPAGLVEQDDMENWIYAHKASRGVIAKRYPYNYQMGIGHTIPVQGSRGAVTVGTHSEENARTLYRRWLQLMESGNQGDRKAARRGASDHGSQRSKSPAGQKTR